MYYVYLTPLGLVGIALLLLSLVAVRFTVRQNAELREAHIETMRILSEVLDARDPYTHGHSTRVAELAKAITEVLGLPEPEQQVIESAALLHDIGKMTVGDDILFKGGSLNNAEYARMQEHPERGAQMIRPIGFLREVQQIVRYHHERYDGGGYPRGIAGAQIPLGARILAVADAWDAMVIDRAYRPAYSHEYAARQIRAGRGTQFDPRIVDVFLDQVLPAKGILVPKAEAAPAPRAAPAEGHPG
ncbi:HD-GYP domain-containing protein [Limnochorda pilosa]|nr:HD-GYP domain-containing protein [Limnochorda pilosa]